MRDTSFIFFSTLLDFLCGGSRSKTKPSVVRTSFRFWKYLLDFRLWRLVLLWEPIWRHCGPPLGAHTVSSVIGWNDSGCVGDWRRLTTSNSDNERGGALQTLGGRSVHVCVYEQRPSMCAPMCVFVCVCLVCIYASVHIAHFAVCVQECKSTIRSRFGIVFRVRIYACVFLCVLLPGDTTAPQLVWPQGYAALSFSVALHLWQLSSTCACVSWHTARRGTFQLVERWKRLSPCPWDDSRIVSLSLGEMSFVS